MDHFYEEIEGWFDFEELYREAVRRMPQGEEGSWELKITPRPIVMVEVGVYKGRSLFFLAVEAENSGKPIEVFAVDRFNWPVTAMQDFARLRQAHGLTERVHMVTADSLTASRGFSDDALDFVFLDAGHEYPDIESDIRAWWPKVRRGGILAGHDYGHPDFPGVAQAVNEHFQNVEGLSDKLLLFPPTSTNPGVHSWWVEKP